VLKEEVTSDVDALPDPLWVGQAFEVFAVVDRADLRLESDLAQARDQRFSLCHVCYALAKTSPEWTIGAHERSIA